MKTLRTTLTSRRLMTTLAIASLLVLSSSLTSTAQLPHTLDDGRIAFDEEWAGHSYARVVRGKSVEESAVVFIVFHTGPVTYTLVREELFPPLIADPKVEAPEVISVRIIGITHDQVPVIVKQKEPSNDPLKVSVTEGYSMLCKAEIKADGGVTAGQYEAVVSLPRVNQFAAALGAPEERKPLSFTFEVTVYGDDKALKEDLRKKDDLEKVEHDPNPSFKEVWEWVREMPKKYALLGLVLSGGWVLLVMWRLGKIRAAGGSTDTGGGGCVLLMALGFAVLCLIRVVFIWP